MNGYNVICFDSTGVEYIPREIKQIIGKKNVTTDFYRIEAYGFTFIGKVY